MIEDTANIDDFELWRVCRDHAKLLLVSAVVPQEEHRMRGLHLECHQEYNNQALRLW